MRTTTLKTTLMVFLAVNSSLAMSEVTTNIGFASEYYYRGILQKESSASAGIDYEQSGFSLGLWSADVGDGLEYDIYGAYEHSFSDDFSASLGFTHYYYTGEFDDTYEEINFGLNYQFVSLGYSVGSWDGGTNAGDDYDFLTVTIEHEGFFGTYGTFGDEFDGDYFELGYGTELGGFDTAITLIISSDELTDQLDSSGNPTESEALVFSVSKTFNW